MSTVAAGASEVITVTEGATLLLSSSKTDVARLTITTGPGAGKVVTNSHAGRRRYGPFGAGTVTLEVVVGYCTYYLSTEGANDIEEVAEYVTIASTDLSGLNTAGRPVPKGVLLKEPSTSLLYGQSDGAGGYTGIGSSASSNSSGGGTDWKLATDDTAPSGGVRVDTYTDDSGLIWTRNYNDAGDGSLQNETALGGALTRTWSYTSGGIGYISAGASRKSGGAYSVLAADMASIRTELITLGTAADAPQFWVSDYDNGTGATGLTVEWDKANAGFMNVNRRNLYWNANLSVAHSSTSESSALVTVSIPGWLAHKNCMTGVRARFDKSSGTDTLAINVKVNGTTVRSASSANLYVQLVGTLVARNATNSWERPSAASGFDISAGTSGAGPVLDTFDQTAGLSFTVTMQRTLGVEGNSGTFRFFQIWREF